MKNNLILFCEFSNEFVELQKICIEFGLKNLFLEIEKEKRNILLNDYYEIENKVYKFYLKIRNDIFKLKKMKLKSPNLKNNTNYDYERGFEPVILENKYTKFYKFNENECLIFRSGMSSIDAVFKFIIKKFDLSKMKMISMNFYFETKTLINNLYYKIFDIDKCNTYYEFYKKLKEKKYNIIFLETININFPNEHIDLEYFFEILNLSTSPLILIVDTTADFKIFSIDKLLKKIKRKIIVFEIKSGIKLYQLGLELSNLGIVNITTNTNEIDLSILKKKYDRI